MATVRELLTEWGFEVDDNQLDGLEQKIGKVKKTADAMGKTLGAAGKKITGWGKAVSMRVTLPIIAAGIGIIKLASDAEETHDMFKVVFGGMEEATEHIYKTQMEWVDGMHGKFGLARTDLKLWSANLQDTFVPMGIARDEAAGLSNQVVQLGLDLSSMKNIPIQEAMDRLQGTLVGNHENALKFGVVIKENTLKMELQRMGVKKLGKDYREQDKILARLNLLMAGTTDAHGNLELTINSFANTLRRAKSMSKEFAETFGKDLLPMATKLMAKIAELAIKFGGLDEKTRKTIVLIAGLAAAIGPLLIIAGMLISSVGKIMVFVGVLKKLILTYRILGASALWAQVSMFLIPIAIAAALALVGYLIYRYWDQIKPFFIGLGLWFKEVWTAAVAWFKTAGEWIVGIWTTVSTKIASIAKMIWSVLKKAMLVVIVILTWPWLILLFIINRYWKQISSFFKSVWGYIVAGATAFGSFIKVIAMFFYDLISWQIKILLAFISKYWGLVKSVISVAYDWFKSIVVFWIDKLKWVYDKIAGYAKLLKPLIDKVIDKIKEKLAKFFDGLPGPVKRFFKMLSGGGTITVKTVEEGGAAGSTGGKGPTPTTEDKSNAANVAGGAQSKSTVVNTKITNNISAPGGDPVKIKKAAADGTVKGLKKGTSHLTTQAAQG